MNTNKATNTVKVEIPEQKSYFYPIIIGENILDDTGRLVKKYSEAEKILVVTDKRVYSIYGEKLRASLDEERFKTEFIILEEGEKYKNINSLDYIWKNAADFKLERKDVIIALGGGVIGDTAGFAASTYLRGVDFIQIPTTLLAQVDSSVGGKVAVNLKSGKNLIGNFYQPKFVLSDICTLDSLIEEELKTGLAEVLKYGMIETSCGLNGLETNMLDYLKKNKDAIYAVDKDIIRELVTYCCELKAAVVNADEKESGLRVILNLGHTIGHAVEKCLNYENITHGQAIVIGMKGALYISKTRNLISESYYKYCLELFDIYETNNKIPSSIKPETVYNAMLGDKKVLSGKLRFILPVNEAEVGIFNDTSKENVLTAIKTLY